MKLLILLVLVCGAMAQTKDAPEHKTVKDGKLDTDEDLTGVWKTSNEDHYVFISTPQTWANAQMHCLGLRAHLVVINNKEEEDFVKGLAGGREIWIGLSDAQQNGFWFWINSDSLGHTNWCPGEPNNYRGVQTCALTNYAGQKCWDDQSCGTLHPYVCERKPTL